MADFDLTLTGEQVQQRLNLVPQHAEAIAALQEAIKAFVNSEQVQVLISTALQPYSTTSEMNTAISTAITQALTSYYTKTAADNLLAQKVDKVTGKQLSTEDFTTALKTKLDALPTAANLSTQISTAISNALLSYYTKTETDNLLAAKQTAAQVSAAITSALTSYSTTSQMNTAISTALASYYTKAQTDAAIKTESDRAKAAEQANADEIAALKTVVADIETLAEGYVRVAGSSDPALSYRHYKFNEEGGFSRESAFSLFYPCLVGTKLTGDDAQIGTVLHVLQKLGYEDGNGKALDLADNPHAIDGSEGDVMVCNIEKYYRLAGHFTVEGQEYDAFLLSREPFTWHGYDAEEVERFGMAPDYCVAHQDEDGVTRMHSVYNPAWNGSYTAPVAMVGKYIYHQNEETGVITDEYDATATLLGGAGGLHSTDISLPVGEQYAMNQNDDTTKTVPFMNQTAEGCNTMQALLLAEGGTFDAHRASLMGSGFSANDAANAAVFEAGGSEARNGLRYVNGQGATVYLNLNAGNAFGITGQYTGAMINSWRNPWHIMEAQRAVSYAVRKGVGELEWFVFEGNKYKYRSVPGFNGPSHGEMTCVVWKVLSSQFTNAAIDPADGTTLITGNRIDFIFSTALLHGVTTQVSPAWWGSGLVMTEDENRNYRYFLERDQAELIKTPTSSLDVADNYDFENRYPMVLEVAAGEGYARDYLDGAMMLPRTNALKTGGGLHTYVGKYNWFTGGAAPAGKKSVRGFQRGSLASNVALSPLAMYGHTSPTFAASNIGFGTCCRIR